MFPLLFFASLSRQMFGVQFLCLSVVLVLVWAHNVRIHTALKCLTVYLIISACFHVSFPTLPADAVVLVLKRTGLWILGVVVLSQWNLRVPVALVTIGCLGAIAGFPLVYNTSINLMFLCCLAALVPGSSLVLLGLAVFMGHSSTGLLAFFVLVFRRFGDWILWVFAPFLIMKLVFWPPNFDHSDRFRLWKLAFQVWMRGSVWQRVFGFGFGSFGDLGPRYEALTQFPFGTWYTLHSDILQTAWEVGPIGLMLFGWVAWRGLQTPGPKANALLILLTALPFNFALQIPIVLLLFIWLVIDSPCP